MSDASAPAEYRVLARKYRPTDFAGLVGQEAMVRTLTNALASGRIAHAFILTGVRGGGKTTTARIIARALNCVGADGQGGPTPEPCGECQHCRAITEDRDMDVLEMDAASRTGVDDIRELIDGVRYAPAAARYKVYIIDEVHMLSRNAFNALLKTLEEPPPHVRFVFATTEARKVPLTVLSRCQRFDLRRVDAETLMAHLKDIAAREEVALDDAALALIVRAAEGSVRDALSLLDQAIAHGAGEVGEAQVRDMLGLADRARVLDLFDAAMAGDVRQSLSLLGEQYNAGADPAVVIQDMLELSHWLTRLKVVPEAGDDVTMPEEARQRGREMAARLTMPVLGRTWQMLLKGLEETRLSLAPLAAAEMVLVRLTYAADLPAPAEVVRQLQAGAGAEAAPAAGDGGSAAPGGAHAAAPPSEAAEAPPPSAPAGPPPAGPPPAGTQAALKPEPEAAPEASAQALPPAPRDFAAVVALAAAKREGLLQAQLTRFVHLVRFEPGRIEFRPADGAPANLAGELAQKLAEWTGERWVVTISAEDGAPTLAEQTTAEAKSRRAEVAENPVVRAVLDAFPGAEVREIRDLGPTEEAIEAPAEEDGRESIGDGDRES